LLFPISALIGGSGLSPDCDVFGSAGDKN